MNKTLVISKKVHLTLYRQGLESYPTIGSDMEIELYSLDFPRNELNIPDRLMYKFNINNFKKKYYDKKRAELVELIKEYDQIVFINLFYDDEYFIQGEFEEALKEKTCKVYFVDSIKRIPQDIHFWHIFDKIVSFEYADVSYAKEEFGINVEYAAIGTNYNLYSPGETDERDYDICFVGISTPKRLEYLQAIAELAEKKNYKLFISGHFWHDNNWLNYHIGKLKFQKKYPLLAKYVHNQFIQPSELAKVYKKSKICLNINVAYHKSFNTRNFDIMYSERLLISDYQDLKGVDVLPNKEFIMCDDIADMVNKIDYYLQNPEEVKPICVAARKKVEEKYLFKNSLDVIFKD